MLTYKEIKSIFGYNADTGVLTRLSNMKSCGVTTKSRQYPFIRLNNRKFNARRVVILLQTGKWPDRHEYKFIGEDPRDLRWCNFVKRIDGNNRLCSMCGEFKPIGSFSTNSYCAPCSRAYNARKGRASGLKTKYNITIEQYDEMLDAQGGGCAICGVKPTNKRLAVDHCHTTGKVRGILCTGCNTGLGGFMLAAAKYILELDTPNPT